MLGQGTSSVSDQGSKSSSAVTLPHSQQVLPELRQENQEVTPDRK